MSANLANLNIVNIAISELRPYAQNPREHPPQQIEMIAASMTKFGCVNPILISPDKVVIAGHGRLEAAKRLKMPTMPAIILPHLNEAEQRAYRIADNAIMLKGEWSVELLATELEFIAAADVEFDPVDIGFETGEFDAFVAAERGSASSPEPEVVDEPDRDSPPVSRIGDLWTVGRHRIVCGDARDSAAYERLLGEKRADAVISDMPYNVPINGHVCGLGSIQHREFAMASGEMTRDEFRTFMNDVFRKQAAFSRPGALHFQFIDWRSVGDMIQIGEGVYDSLVNICIWVKPNGGMGSLWRSRHEMICVFRVKGGKHRNNVQLGKFGRNRSNVWEYAGVNSFRQGRLNDLAAHPTCKPVDLVADAIMDCTKPNGLVLDAFLGSGTTLIAAAQTGRRGVGIELDPYYVDTALQRVASAVGAEPVLEDGRPFQSVAGDRASETPPS